MIELEAFCELVREIQGQGVASDLAGEYASLIGDTPLYDEQGRIVVMDGDRELARLKPLRFFDVGELDARR